MNTWPRVLLVTLLAGVPAFLGSVLWPPPPGMPSPTGGQLALFIFLLALEALLFGLGVAFLLFGLPLVRRLTGASARGAWATFISIGWFLVSWWPHDNLHIHTGPDLGTLLFIEYAFHVTLMLAALVVAAAFLRLLRRQHSHVAGVAPLPEAGMEPHVIR